MAAKKGNNNKPVGDAKVATTAKEKPAKAAPKGGQKAAAKKSGPVGPAKWWAVSAQFLREVTAELKKVTWPGKQQVISSTAVVVVLVIVVAAYLGVVDWLLATLVKYAVG